MKIRYIIYIILLFSSLSAQDFGELVLKEYTVKPGKHDFKPNEWPNIWKAKKVDKVIWEFEFEENCKYYWLPDQDQWDWNKGGGLSGHLFKNTKNTLMWAWRFNPEIDSIEITAYVHIDGDRFIGYDSQNQVMLRVAPGDRIRCEIIKHENRLFEVYFIDEMNREAGVVWFFTRDFKYWKRIGLWFGGANNSEGIYGGTPGKKMTVQSGCCRIKN